MNLINIFYLFGIKFSIHELIFNREIKTFEIVFLLFNSQKIYFQIIKQYQL